MATAHQMTQALTAAEILLGIHSGDGASIVFQGSNGCSSLGAIRAAEIQVAWPVIVPQLKTGCYFGINSSGKVYESKANLTGLFASRKRKFLKYLNALYVDIDRHKSGQVDMSALLDESLEVCRINGIPLPTWGVRSGRGVWLLWVFSSALKATDQNKDHWQMAAAELAKFFVPMGIDQATSTDATRVMRVPGSSNRNAGGFRVDFRRHGSEVDFYAMAKTLGVVARPTPITQAETEKRIKNPTKVRAAREVWKRRFVALEKLVKMRGTFSEGSRSWIVFYLAQAMTRAGMEKAFIETKCYEVATVNCQPPLEAEVIERKIASAKNKPHHGGYASLEAIIKCFDVSETELNGIPELKKKQRPSKGLKARRSEILKLIAGCESLSLRDLMQIVQEAGFKVPRTTLWRYVDLITRGASCASPPAPGFSASREDQEQTQNLPCSISTARKSEALYTVLAANLKQENGAKKKPSWSVQ